MTGRMTGWVLHRGGTLFHERERERVYKYRKGGSPLQRVPALQNKKYIREFNLTTIIHSASSWENTTKHKKTIQKM